MQISLRDTEVGLQWIELVSKANKLVELGLCSGRLSARLDIFMGDGDSRLSDYLSQVLKRKAPSGPWISPEAELTVTAELTEIVPADDRDCGPGVALHFHVSASEVCAENWTCDLSLGVSEEVFTEFVHQLVALEQLVLSGGSD